MKLAILSPSDNQYSETFIEAHRKYLKGEIFYYCKGQHPSISNGKKIIHGRIRSFLNFIQE